MAADVLAQIDPEASPPRSVRESGIVAWRFGVADPGELAGAVAEAVTALAGLTGDGTLAVIVPEGRLAEVGAAVQAALPDTAVGDPGLSGPESDRSPAGDLDIERPVVVLTVRQAKGLEFDSVLVADPALILAESARGLGDLYVALTRATQRAGVVYPGEPPRVLRRMTEVSGLAEVRKLEGRAVPEAEVA